MLLAWTAEIAVLVLAPTLTSALVSISILSPAPAPAARPKLKASALASIFWVNTLLKSKSVAVMLTPLPILAITACLLITSLCAPAPETKPPAAATVTGNNLSSPNALIEILAALRLLLSPTCTSTSLTLLLPCSI